LKKIIIAIDGYSGCGKSTIARALAARLHYVYIDTGAMYRAVTYYCITNHVDWNNEAELSKALSQISIKFERINGDNITMLNGENVESEIRSMEVNDKVSDVATLSAVRKEMVAQQRHMGTRKGVILDGRDIGTVVFVGAELKIFLKADIDIRVKRRYDQFKKQGLEVDMESIKQNLLRRDHIDSTRMDSPLMKAEDAIEIDNSHMTESEQLDYISRLALDKIND